MTTTTKPPPMPCAFDARPLRITLFPEHPQTILIYVPDGQSLWLPTLPTPFDCAVVSAALDDRDVPHDTRVGERNRWWRNIKQSEDEEKAVLKQRKLEAEAERVRIHLSQTADTLEKQRLEVVLMMHKVDSEIRQLKRGPANVTTLDANTLSDANQRRTQRLADLQTTSLALQQKLTELKKLKKQQHHEKLAELKERQKELKQQQYQRHQQRMRRQRTREERFLQKVKRHLPPEQFMAIWAEIEVEIADDEAQEAQVIQ